MNLTKKKLVSYTEVMGFIWPFMWRQKWTFFSIFIQNCLNCLDTLMWPFFFGWIIDICTLHEGARMVAWGSLKAPLIGIVCLIIFIEINARTAGFLVAKAIPKLQQEIRLKMFDHIQHHSPRYFNERFAGSLAGKITDMTNSVESIFHTLHYPLIPSGILIILGAIFLWAASPIFTLILALWLPLHLGVCIVFGKKCDFYQQRHGESRATLLGKIVDSLTNNFTVNLFYRMKHEKEALTPFQKDEYLTNVFAQKYVEKIRCIISILFLVTFSLGMQGSMIYLWLHSYITTGQMVLVSGIAWNIASIMWSVGSTLPYFFQSWGTIKQAYSVMLDPKDIDDTPNAKKLEVGPGEIIFDNVSFYYNDGKKIFENKNVHIYGGEKVGIVGFTGAGKSSFINLILRFFPLSHGKILIDGQDLANVTLESLRRQIALIPQDPILFHRTLRENIAYGKPDATPEEIFHAAKLAHCDEFIQNIPQGYEAKVGERGTKLSGGERQRIAIARAILVDAPILILDEATSSLDSITEMYIQDSLEILMQNRTTIAIAHRLSTLSRMDRILVFDKGKIVEEGPHALLLQCNGLYAKMWNMQMNGLIPMH